MNLAHIFIGLNDLVMAVFVPFPTSPPGTKAERPWADTNSGQISIKPRDTVDDGCNKPASYEGNGLKQHDGFEKAA
jgi:hypothetical protein